MISQRAEFQNRKIDWKFSISKRRSRGCKVRMLTQLSAKEMNPIEEGEAEDLRS